MEPRDPIMDFFSFAHLPEALQAVSKPFCELAEHVHAMLPRCVERSVALRKLLEGKDAAVRAAFGPAPREVDSSGDWCVTCGHTRFWHDGGKECEWPADRNDMRISCQCRRFKEVR
jgi:hypothetical protein